MISRLIIDSTSAKTELCELGEIIGTDKSPYNKIAHRHPYTAVYNMLLAPLKNKPIRFAEIGVAMGASAIMWDVYFKHPEAELKMFDRDENILMYGRNIVGKRVQMSLMDVSVEGDVKRALVTAAGGEDNLYDVIIDDSSHAREHQVSIIKEALPRLKSGGMIIVEDIFRSESEEYYETELKDIIPLCAAYYFVVCEHQDKWSPGWDNDKLLVLVKA